MVSVMDDEFPEYAETSELGNKGRRIVEAQVHENLGWLFRELKKDDLGIDGFVEVIQPDRTSKGRTFAVQIKCGRSFFREETPDGYVYRGSISHLNYWISHSLAVVLILCDPDSRSCYWVSIEPKTVDRHTKGWSVIVPKSKTLTAECKWQLEDVVARPLANDLISVALYRLLIEKFPGIEIAQTLETPHDFYYFKEMARRDGRFLLVTYLYRPTRSFELTDIEEVIEARKRCGELCGWNDNYPVGARVIIFFVAHSIKELQLSEAVKTRLAERPDFDFYRVVCNFRFGVSLSEVDENGGLVQLYDRVAGKPETFGAKAS
jgi:hypothetical protein